MSGEKNPSFVPDEPYNYSLATSIDSKLNDNVFGVELQDVKNNLKDEYYDPYEHRKVEHPTTNAETLLHLLKGSLGTGILAMPNAFHHAGYAVGIVGTMLIGALCTYCIHILIKSQYELCKQKKVPSMTYPATAECAFNEGPLIFKSFASASVHVINTFLLIYQLGTCCVYVVFVASNIKAVVDYNLGTQTDVRLYMLAILLPLILINWVRNLKFLAPFSTLANIITIVSFGIILYYVFHDPLSLDKRESIGELQHFPLFFGTVLFALEAIGVIMPLENEMKTPKSFGGKVGVLNISMVSIVVLYVGMGFFGYIKYGEDAQGSITLNLPDQVIAQVAKVMLALAIIITHGLECYVAIDITWIDYIGKKLEENPHKLFYEYLIRTSLVLITCG
ncbi:proton-coupled amino acid transporter-like protein CG1139 [Ctenocephalides felis]|uniref:proton-coupled amino acid transporter-like protein CG1139 n=1 Tax=Ctenocephalides felis TaxID=7515 RepID=UPI000E6E19DA|nr:proton-coupled amino acid transporter-like protein CG1139 [Ctenocephalides felis]